MVNTMEQEDKVNIELIQEVPINIDCVKEEFDEGLNFSSEINDKMRLKYENVSEENLDTIQEEENNLIDYLNDDLMEERNVKLEITEILITKPENFYCNECGENYDGFCQKCSSLSYILNNIIPNSTSNLDFNSTPINILEIRDIASNNRVFTLKSLPKSVIFGPFQGVSAIESTNGLRWKIGDCKFVNDGNANWMKYVACATNQFSNLDIFQFAGDLYFETCREVKENEELLMWLGEEVKFDNEKECYFVAVKKEEFPKTFACSLCCLGFRLERYLIEHKSKCPHGKYNGNIDDFEIVECRCCKVWLEKQEYLERHKLYCLENYNRARNISRTSLWIQYEDTSTAKDEDASCPITVPTANSTQRKIKFSPYLYETNGETNISEEKDYKCSKCSFRTNYKNSLKRHLNAHTAIKSYQCDICEISYNDKSNLKVHIQNKHSNTGEKEYKCSECSYQTNRKDHLKLHLNAHTDIKPECEICKKKFIKKASLKLHIENKHSNTNEKKYKCSVCSFQTNYKNLFEDHLNIHSDIKPYQCSICNAKFITKVNLKMHVKNEHSNEKEYKCWVCSYETSYKSSLKQHLNAYHSNDKRFECDICKKKFTLKNTLKVHIENIHSNTSEKEYKCPQCSYQTYFKHCLDLHLNTHKDIKPFECDICKKGFNHEGGLKRHLKTHNNIKPFECDICKKRFNHKCNLREHVKNHHSNTNEKEYKCPQCSYQTNQKGNLTLHLNTHNDIKSFECDICKKRFTLKNSLKVHIENIHSNTSEKEYKCIECPYQTNFKHRFKEHLNTHNDIKPFECDICKKRIRHKSSLKLHIKNEHSNTNEKEYKCSECAFQTNYKHSLKSHLNTHNNIKPFQCDICRKNFVRESNLKHHRKNEHLQMREELLIN